MSITSGYVVANSFIAKCYYLKIMWLNHWPGGQYLKYAELYFIMKHFYLVLNQVPKFIWLLLSVPSFIQSRHENYCIPVTSDRQV